MQRESAGKYGEDWDDDAAAGDMPPPQERPTSGNAGKKSGEKKTGKRPSPDEAPGAVRVDGNKATRPTSGNAGKLSIEKKMKQKNSSTSQPGVVRFDGEEENTAAYRKAQANVPRKFPAVHDSADMANETDDDLGHAAAYHTPEMASMPRVDALASSIGEEETLTAGTRQIEREIKYEDGKTTGMDNKGLPFGKRTIGNDESNLNLKHVAVTLDHRESGGKWGRRNGSGAAGGFQSKGDENKTVSTSRRHRTDRHGLNEGTYVVQSDDSEEEFEADMDRRPGARRVTGINSPSPVVGVFDLDGAQTQRNLQEEAPNVTDYGMPKATAIDENEDVEPEIGYGAEDGDVFQAEEVDKIEIKRGFKGCLQRHKRLATCVVIIIVAVIAVSVGLALRDDDEPSPSISPFDEVYRNSTERFQLGADLLLNRSISVERLLLSPSRSTSQFLALDWLANEDEKQLNLADNDQAEFIIQRYALAVFYFSTGGQEWLGSTNFITSSDECEWTINREGGSIDCDADGFVTHVSFEEINLNGTIPDELGHLSMLRELELSTNENLAGSIPATVSLLQNLEVFRANNANITGTIPDGIGDLSKLREFHSDGNSLEGTIPSTVGRLTHLVDWFSQFNSLSGTLPTEMGSMSSLQHLILKSNSLSGSIPSTMSALTNLTEVDISLNKFEGDAENLCSIEGASFEKFDADCIEQLVPPISKEIHCSCCSSCCSEMSDTCEPNVK